MMARRPKKVSELQAARDSGDFAGMLAALYRAGHTETFIRYVEHCGIEPGTAAAELVVEILSGTFKRSRHDPMKVHKVLADVHMWSQDLAERREDLKGWAAREADRARCYPLFAEDSLRRAAIRNLQDVYEYVAELNGMTLEAVEQTVKRYTLWPDK